MTKADPDTDSHMVDCLRRTSWDQFAPSVAGLADDKPGREAFGRSYRCVERARRVVVTASRLGRGTELFMETQKWLASAAEAIGQAIKHSSMVS